MADSVPASRLVWEKQGTVEEFVQAWEGYQKLITRELKNNEGQYQKACLDVYMEAGPVAKILLVTPSLEAALANPASVQHLLVALEAKQLPGADLLASHLADFNLEEIAGPVLDLLGATKPLFRTAAAAVARGEEEGGGEDVELGGLALPPGSPLSPHLSPYRSPILTPQHSQVFHGQGIEGAEDMPEEQEMQEMAKMTGVTPDALERSMRKAKELAERRSRFTQPNFDAAATAGLEDGADLVPSVEPAADFPSVSSLAEPAGSLPLVEPVGMVEANKQGEPDSSPTLADGTEVEQASQVPKLRTLAPPAGDTPIPELTRLETSGQVLTVEDFQLSREVLPEDPMGSKADVAPEGEGGLSSVGGVAVGMAAAFEGVTVAQPTSFEATDDGDSEVTLTKTPALKTSEIPSASMEVAAEAAAEEMSGTEIAVTEAAPASAPEPVPEPVKEAIPVSEPNPEPAAEAASEAAHLPVLEEAIPEPALDTTAKPATKAALDLAFQPAPGPVEESVSVPVPQAGTEAEMVVEDTTAEPVAAPAPTLAPPVAALAPVHIPEAITKPPTEPASQPVLYDAGKVALEPESEPLEETDPEAGLEVASKAAPEPAAVQVMDPTAKLEPEPVVPPSEAPPEDETEAVPPSSVSVAKEDLGETAPEPAGTLPVPAASVDAAVSPPAAQELAKANEGVAAQPMEKRESQPVEDGAIKPAAEQPRSGEGEGTVAPRAAEAGSPAATTGAAGEKEVELVAQTPVEEEEEAAASEKAGADMGFVAAIKMSKDEELEDPPLKPEVYLEPRTIPGATALMKEDLSFKELPAGAVSGLTKTEPAVSMPALTEAEPPLVLDLRPRPQTSIEAPEEEARTPKLITSRPLPVAKEEIEVPSTASVGGLTSPTEAIATVSVADSQHMEKVAPKPEVKVVTTAPAKEDSKPAAAKAKPKKSGGFFSCCMRPKVDD